MSASRFPVETLDFSTPTPNCDFLSPNLNFPNPSCDFPTPNLDFPTPILGFPSPRIDLPIPNCDFRTRPGIFLPKLGLCHPNIDLPTLQAVIFPPTLRFSNSTRATLPPPHVLRCQISQQPLTGLAAITCRQPRQPTGKCLSRKRPVAGADIDDGA